MAARRARVLVYVTREGHEQAGFERVLIDHELPVLGDRVARSEYDNHAFEVRVQGGGAADTWEHVGLDRTSTQLA